MEQHMAIRQELAEKICEWMRDQKLSQRKLATFFDTTQMRINDLLHMKIHNFSIDALVKFSNQAGFNIAITMTEKE